MQIFSGIDDPQVATLLNQGAVGVLRTDTLYGIVCQATNEQSVERIYQLKDRAEHKSPIVLIASASDIFDTISEKVQQVLRDVWPGPVSVIIPSHLAPKWLRRENDSVAYRLPANDSLVMLLKQTGPLIAPSANPEGQPPAMNLHEAEGYFGNDVDFYVDGGDVPDASPSQLLRVLPDGEIERLR